MMKTFLYIRGEPGSGKITIAKILEKRLGWKLFWLHELDAICKIVGDHRVPRLMDEITGPILRHLLEQGDNIIYVRPSRQLETVERVRSLVSTFPDYKFVLIGLTASYGTLLERVLTREPTECRIHTREMFDEYISQISYIIPGNIEINTTKLTPDEVADLVEEVIDFPAGKSRG